MRLRDIRVIEPATVLPVTVDEFINHARLNGITVDRQPDLIERELWAATRRGESFTRRSFMTQTLQALFVPDCTPTLIALPRGHVQEVTEVKAGSAALDPPDADGGGGWAVDEWGIITLTGPASEPVSVTFISGYEDEADIPEPVREGILEYATALYEDRNGSRAARYMAEAGHRLPQGVEDLWRTWQIELGG